MNTPPPEQPSGTTQPEAVSAEAPPSLRDLIRLRLAGSSLAPEAQALLLECLGEETTSSRERAPRAYLQSVTVSGFRGIGRTARLPLTPGPGLTLVVGRNGSGKSSFAEAIEIALTGDNARWKTRSDIWRRSWRNLHEGNDPQVAVELLVEGDTAPSTVYRAWTGQDVAESHAEWERPGHEPAPLTALGWERDLAHYRPFLSYSELGALIGGKPSEMYDAVAAILGLEQLAGADKRLMDQSKELDGALKQAAAELPALIAELGAVDDPRAAAAVSALSGRTQDLDQAAALVAGQSTIDGDALTGLRRLAELTGPDLAAVGAAVARLREAAAGAEDARATSAEDSWQRAELLSAALDHHRRHPARPDCPVCGSNDRIDGHWAAAAAEQVDRLREDAADARAARRELSDAGEALRNLVVPPPAWLPPDLAELWRAWAGCRSLTEAGAAELASRAESSAAVLADACRLTSQQAAKQLAEHDEEWRGHAARLAAWLERARTAETGRPRLNHVKAARKWLKDAHEDLRAERMRPIANGAQATWAALRQRSNVSLGPVQLGGTGTQRRVVLDVSVDDIDAPALGVMSQGELHSLALSLFLPRTTLAENPFPFLVIDDPVQSMDPAKVEGLATVLSALALQQQVVVFTHDTRLPQALKYLRLPATILEVVRRERSVVQVKQGDDPVKQALYDAKALTKARNMPPEVVSRVLPGLCRTALEAAFLPAARRRLLRSGRDHASVEREISRAHKLTELAALAMYGDRARSAEVLPDLERAYGGWAAELIRLCNRGSHEAVPVPDVDELIDETKRLAGKVQEL
ncbi:AAA family ATPase [Streptomyces sp. NPDC026673]|uniref:AAA family ATPase n=1 Tax=Streptomyces sp. NPDC026673 TaxID=3155724 RepID=UPI0033EF9519